MTRPDIVLIPGLLLKADLYREQLPSLHGVCRSVQVPDHSLDADLPAIARRVLDAAPPRFLLCGLSMGGYIAFEILRQAPERVLKLALLDTMAPPDTETSRANRKATLTVAKSQGIEVVSQAFYPRWVHPRWHSDSELNARVVNMAKATGVEGFERQQTAITNRPDSQPTLKAITCPTLVVVGRQDGLTPVSEAQTIASGIAGSRLEVLEDCGHLAPMEQPARVTQILMDWVDNT